MDTDSYVVAIADIIERFAFLIPTGIVDEDPEWAVQGRVAWSGPDGSGGWITVALDRGAAEALAANALGLAPGSRPAEQDLRDGCSELANVIAGNLLAVKYGQNHEFLLHPPEIVGCEPLDGAMVVRLALLEGVLGVGIAAGADNSRILRAVVLPPGRHP